MVPIGSPAGTFAARNWPQWRSVERRRRDAAKSIALMVPLIATAVSGHTAVGDAALLIERSTAEILAISCGRPANRIPTKSDSSESPTEFLTLARAHVLTLNGLRRRTEFPEFSSKNGANGRRSELVCCVPLREGDLIECN